MTTPLSKADRLAIGAAVAPTVRRAADRPRKVTVVDKDGKPIRETTHVEVAKAVLARSEIEFSVQEGKRPEWVTCKLCRRPIKINGRGRPVYCPSGCVGATFGRWTVVGAGAVPCSWRCRCACGSAERDVLVKSLIAGKSVSCGCEKSDRIHERYLAKAVSHIGERHGILTITGVSHAPAPMEHLMVCQCDCGNPWNGPYTCLRTGRVTSCGCRKLAQSRTQAHFDAKLDERIRSVIGQRSGRLVVTALSMRIAGALSRQKFACVCDCGNTCTRTYSALFGHGGVSSCGCYAAKIRRHENRDATGSFAPAVDAVPT